MSEQARQTHASQGGFVLPMVLLLLAVGALLLVPTTQFAWASLNANQVTEWKASELFDADAGVEEAVRWIQYDGNTGSGWSSVESGRWQRSSLTHTLNGSAVAVEIERVADNVYKITSTATSPETDTTIVAYVVAEHADFSMLLDSAITSVNDVQIQPGDVVNGDIRMGDDDNLDNKGTVNGNVKDDETEGWSLAEAWPDAQFLKDWFRDSLADEAPYDTWEGNTTVTIPAGTSEANPYEIGPLLITGDFTLKGDGWVKLLGTVYVAGDFVANPTANIYLDMNKQTIFAEGTIYIGPHVSVSNSGCFVAVGDVDFQPNDTSEADEFILIMSINGTTKLRPGDDFYGCVVGDCSVELQPGVTLNWVDPEGKGINFPMGEGEEGDVGTSVTVPSYVIS